MVGRSGNCGLRLAVTVGDRFAQKRPSPAETSPVLIATGCRWSVQLSDQQVDPHTTMSIWEIKIDEASRFGQVWTWSEYLGGVIWANGFVREFQ